MKAIWYLVWLVMLLAADAFADWPQWRGPHRDGLANDSNLPSDWPLAAAPPLWRVRIGEGYSSAAMSRNRVCIMGRQGEEEICYCIDAQSGKELWRYAYPQPFQTHPGAKSAGLGPKSTPTIDGDCVYMLGIDGRFHCFDLTTGRVIWEHDFAKEYWGVEKDGEGYDKWKPFCGLAASPLIEGGLVIVPVGGKKAGALAAFDKATGKLVWKCLDDRSSYASPMAVDLAGVRQIVGFTGTRIIGAAASDGRLLWEYPFEVPYDDTIVTPVISDDVVFVCGWAKPTTALRITCRDGKWEHTEVWQNTSLRTSISTPICWSGHLYGFSNSGRILCVHMETGRTLWTSDAIGTYASLVLVKDQLLALNEAGVLHVMEAMPKEYRRRAKLTLSESGETWAHLAVSGQRIYVKDKAHLTCYVFNGKR